ncbi:hypothetical protein [Paraburkholderia tropica]|uniref:hypothetical protein n=1 Tax=Paraburkholderia tropica TaxID=92647 RepID=UPI003D2E471F
MNNLNYAAILENMGHQLYAGWEEGGPLHAAIGRRNVQQVKNLVEKGASIYDPCKECEQSRKLNLVGLSALQVSKAMCDQAQEMELEWGLHGVLGLIQQQHQEIYEYLFMVDAKLKLEATTSANGAQVQRRKCKV